MHSFQAILQMAIVRLCGCAYRLTISLSIGAQVKILIVKQVSCLYKNSGGFCVR